MEREIVREGADRIGGDGLEVVTMPHTPAETIPWFAFENKTSCAIGPIIIIIQGDPSRPRHPPR